MPFQSTYQRLQGIAANFLSATQPDSAVLSDPNPICDITIAGWGSIKQFVACIPNSALPKCE